MLDYLKKFNALPAEVKQKVSNPEAMAIIENLEKKYRLPLAAFIMRVMAREIALADLARFLRAENLSETASKQLAEELKEKIFAALGDYFPPADFLPRGRTGGAEKPAENFAPLPIATNQAKRAVKAAESSDRPAARGASFFFSPDDEKEIRELAKKIDLAEKNGLSASPAGRPAEKIEVKLEAIISRAQINFGSSDLAGRFKQILKTYLRGIRNKLETELTLTKPFASGGLSFDKNSAQKLMAIADKVLNSEVLSGGQAGLIAGEALRPVKPPAKIRIPGLENIQEKKAAIIRDAPYDFSKLVKGDISDRLKPEDLSHELAPLTPARPAEASAKLAVAAAKQGFEPWPQEKKPIPAKPEKKILSEEPSSPVRRAEVSAKQAEQIDNAGQLPLIRRRFEAENLSPSQKVKVEDVKYVPRVMSPLDEIKYLSLINFRRLDKDPLRAIEKIKSKIDLLEEEGYSKRLEGIKLWRLSPINKLYLEIGHLSIGENKPVDVIIEERRLMAGDYLTAAEFQAIMDLNKSLRF